MANDWRTLLIEQHQREAALKSPGTVGRGVRGLASDGDWTAIRPYNGSPVCAFNSYWTFLAERGLLGVALAVLGLGVLFVSYIVRLALAVKYLRTQDDADIFIFACPPVVWVTPFALALLFVLAVYEPVFDIVPMLFVCMVPLALAAASFPKRPTPRKKAAQLLEGEGR